MIHVKLITRWLVFIIGLFIISFGVALSVKADLGISPISCIPYVISLGSRWSLGTLTIAFNFLLILMQIAILRKNYRIHQLVQLPVIILFGLCIDLSMSIVSGMTVNHYVPRLILCLLSCIVIGIGVFIEIKAELTYLPGDGLSLAINKTFGIEFGKAKVRIDSSMVGGGILLSLILHARLLGIREGTIIAALLIGFIARQLNKRLVLHWSISSCPNEQE